MQYPRRERRLVKLTSRAETDIRPPRAEAIFVSVYFISGVYGTSPPKLDNLAQAEG